MTDSGADRADGEGASGWVLLPVAGLLFLLAGVALLAQRSAPGRGLPREAPEAGEAARRRPDYREAGRISVPLRAPRGLAVDAAGNVYVVGDGKLVRFSPAGALTGRVELGSPARCVAAAADGTLYVGLERSVAVLDAGLRVRARWRCFSARTLLTGVAAGGGRVYAADAGEKVVWRLDRRGVVLGRITGRGEGGGFAVPSPYFDVCVARNGVWVADPGRHRVELYTEGGKPRFSFGRAGTGPGEFCGCCNPSHLALLPGGDLVTSEKGIARVQVFSPQGVFKALVAGPGGFSPHARGLDLATDAAGRILVLDPPARAVRIFVPGDGGRQSGQRAYSRQSYESVCELDRESAIPPAATPLAAGIGRHRRRLPRRHRSPPAAGVSRQE